MPELKIYTISDLREWLMHNKATESLSEQVIAPARAWAILHNPYVKDDDPVVAAIFEEGEVVAYTAAFPEVLESPKMGNDNGDDKRFWWFTTLYCNPKYQGNGYGLVVVGSLAEKYGEDCAWDRFGIPETVQVFKYLGNQTLYTTRYLFGDKDIKKSTIKGKMAFMRQELQKNFNRAKYKSVENGYKLKYLSYVDDETYSFILKSRGKDLFLHSQQMLNWELAYPFMQSCPLIEKVNTDMEFHSARNRYTYFAVQVLSLDTIIGFYVLRLMDNSLSAIYCYADEDKKELSFASIVDHIHKLSAREFFTDNECLADYIDKHYYFPKKCKRKVSFSPPKSLLVPDSYSLQFGDGDCFA